MGNEIGKSMKIMINGLRNYSLNELKSELLKKYINERNELYFENCVVAIGNQDGKLITEYKDENGEIYDFWKFTRTIKKTGHPLQLGLLTTYLSRKGERQKNSLHSISKTHNEFATVSDYESKKTTNDKKMDELQNEIKDFPTSTLLSEKTATNDAIVMKPMTKRIIKFKEMDNSQEEMKEFFVSTKMKKTTEDSIDFTSVPASEKRAKRNMIIKPVINDKEMTDSTPALASTQLSEEPATRNFDFDIVTETQLRNPQSRGKSTKVKISCSSKNKNNFSVLTKIDLCSS